jgi:uncharacterized protein (TIGR02246 family)
VTDRRFPEEDNMADLADLIDTQVKAFNARDLEQFLGCYAQNAVVKDGDGNVLMSGIESIREMYGQLFRNSPQLAAEIPSRMTVGDFVIDEEEIDGFNLPGYPVQIHAVAVYRGTDGVIREVTLLM